MRAPKVRNAKRRGKQYNSNLVQGSPMHYAIAGACVFSWTEEKCCFVLYTGIFYYYFRTIENKVWFARYCFKVDVSKIRSTTVLFCRKEKGKVTART